MRQFSALLDSKRISFLFWNYAPNLKFSKNGRDFAYDAFVSCLAQVADETTL